ncbi:hypothetical protein AYI68_g428 [Smittium mucronatum]|uniref:Uncharacterized protein n=1 Tax=Smittium mucronatum TaxID=133383 RepID=A0A1R0H842_9FUNG|nr:hypothetical protein AYI68_g428 [Smittium mucronatum]
MSCRLPWYSYFVLFPYQTSFFAASDNPFGIGPRIDGSIVLSGITEPATILFPVIKNIVSLHPTLKRHKMKI